MYITRKAHALHKRFIQHSRQTRRNPHAIRRQLQTHGQRRQYKTATAYYLPAGRSLQRRAHKAQAAHGAHVAQEIFTAQRAKPAQPARDPRRAAEAPPISDSSALLSAGHCRRSGRQLLAACIHNSRQATRSAGQQGAALNVPTSVTMQQPAGKSANACGFTDEPRTAAAKAGRTQEPRALQLTT